VPLESKRNIKPRSRAIHKKVNCHQPMKNRIGRVASTIIVLALTALQDFAASTFEPWTFTCIAGKAGTIGSADGLGSEARFNTPYGVALDSAGNIYVADISNCTIRRMTPVGTNWMVTTLAGKAGLSGSTDGIGSAARFNLPGLPAVDTSGSIYVPDIFNHTIRKVTPVGTNWVVTTLAGKAGVAGSADGIGNAARFNGLSGVALDSAGNIYVADCFNCTIRKVAPIGTNWVVTTLAGKAGTSGSTDGMGSVARFYNPAGLAVDSAGNLYVGDEFNNTIRKLAPVGTDWGVTTIAGKAGTAGTADGTGSAAQFNFRDIGGDLALDATGSIYVPDTFNHTIRKVTPVGTNWVVTTLAGKAGVAGRADGTGSAARFNGPSGVAVDSTGNLFVVDWGDNTILSGHPALVISSSGPGLGFTGGHFGFDLAGQAGKVVVVEGSADLANWLPLWTNTLAGPLSFSDPQSSGHSSRFYRAQAK
jgi:hypothetical protein